MRQLVLRGFAGGVAGALLLTFLGCGDLEGNNPGSASGDTTQTSELLRRRRPPAPQPPPPTNVECAGGGLTTDQVIKAAQTSDGAAIPQPSCPNHACPEVVVRLGFWSCPTIGDTCASGGRSCTCSRTDGEGQFPSWICN